MLRFGKSQFAAFAQAQQSGWIIFHRPLLVAEFGEDLIERIEPLEDVLQAAEAAGFDEGREPYRFARVIAGLSKLAENDRRHVVVARIASSYQSREERLDRMERTALGDHAGEWRVRSSRR